MACLNIEPEEIVEINIHDKLISNFSVLDVFVKVACHLSRGGKLEVIGKSIAKIKTVKNLTPFVNDNKNQIIGNVIYIDNYGNVITNITKSFFREISKARDFEISVRNYKFKKIFSKYSDIVNFNIAEEKRNNDGQAMAIFNSNYISYIFHNQKYFTTIRNNYYSISQVDKRITNCYFTDF